MENKEFTPRVIPKKESTMRLMSLQNHRKEREARRREQETKDYVIGAKMRMKRRVQ